MNEIKVALTSPVWWISVVIVGIIVNVFSSYLRSLLDVRLSKFSKQWRERSEAKKNKWESYVQSLANAPHRQLLESQKSIRLRIMTVQYLVLGSFMMGIIQLSEALGDSFAGRVVIYAFAGVTYFISFLVFQEAARITRAIDEAIETEVQD